MIVVIEKRERMVSRIRKCLDFRAFPVNRRYTSCKMRQGQMARPQLVDPDANKAANIVPAKNNGCSYFIKSIFAQRLQKSD